MRIPWRQIWVGYLRVPLLSLWWSGLALAFLVALLALILTSQLPSPAATPMPTPTAIATPTPTPTPSVSPQPQVRFTLNDKGKTQRSWWVAPAAVELAGTAKSTADEREDILRERLAQEVESTPLDGKPPYADQSLGVTVVRSENQVLVTVMPEDLPEYAQRLNDDSRRALELQVAQQWSDIIHQELQRLRVLASPTYRGRIGWIMLCLVLIGLCLQQLLNCWGRYVLDSPLWGAKTLLWAMILTWALELLPGAEGLGYLMSEGVAGPLFNALVLGMVATGLDHFGRYALRRYLRTVAQTQRYRGQARAQLRLVTQRHALEFGLRLIITTVTLILIMLSLHFSLASLATGAGLLGASLTFVCQDMIRDFLAGLNVLLEDQFGVGDWVEGAGVSGQVEAFTLRATQIRCSDGSLFCVPNSELRRIKNQSKDWSQVDFRVLIDHQQSLEPALLLLQQELDKLATDLPDSVIEPPTLLGAEEIHRDGVYLRALVRSKPGEHWALKRELNRRVLNRFESEGILLPKIAWNTPEARTGG